MTASYETGAPDSSGWHTWGTVVIGGIRLPLRVLALIVGVTLWLGTMLVRTGGRGIGALWAHALFLFVLVGIGSLTRTLPISRLLRVTFFGGALMGLMYLLGILVVTPLVGQVSQARDLLVPILEQALYLVPVVPVVWASVRGRQRNLGATDVLLLGAAVGVGFGVVEEAYLYTHSSDYLSWLPTVYVGPLRLAASHAVWAALGGAMIGLGLLLRRRGRVWLVVAASGSVIAALDHVANNYSTWSDTLAGLLNLVTLNGWLVVFLFLGVAGACLAGDRYVYRRVPSDGRPVPSETPSRAKRWEAVLGARAEAHARFQSGSPPEVAPPSERGADPSPAAEEHTDG